MNAILAEYRRASLVVRQEQAERRKRVVAHPDLRARLTEPPLSYQRPEQWTGYVPPKLLPQADDQQHTAALNTSARRRVLVELCAEALRREQE